MEKRLKQALKQLKAHEPTISIIFGVVVLIISGIVLYQNRRPLQSPQIESGMMISAENDLRLSDNEAVNVTETADQTLTTGQIQKPMIYTVKKGDTLWSIALEYFNNGYNWQDIADTNGLGTGDLIAIGQQIAIPNAPQRDDHGTVVNQADTNPREIVVQATLLGDAHVVSRGESLWQIAQTIYGEGYLWTKIYDANSDLIADPNRIEIGQALRVPA